MTKPNIYLSGGIENTNDFGQGWRDECSHNLKQLGMNPINISALELNYKSDCYNHIEIPEKDDSRWFKSLILQQYVNPDIQILNDHTHAVVLYYNESVRKGAGTLAEAHHAYYKKIPIYIVNEYKSLNELPSWLIGCSTKVFESFSELYKYLKQIPLEHLVDRNICPMCGTVNTRSTDDVCGYCREVLNVAVNDRYQYMIEQINGE